MSELKGRISVETELPFDYVLREPEGSPRELILLLHGYSHSGQRIFKKLESVMPKGAVVLAPNAPFGFAQKENDRISMGYSWYFYNPETDEYVVGMGPALQFLAGGIEKMGYGELPVRIVGFSQGGYLAPFLGEKLKQTRQVICLHSTYLDDELGATLDFRADNIVGAEDDIVDPANSERCHRLVRKRSRGGEFYKLPVGHRVDEQVQIKAGELLRLN